MTAKIYLEPVTAGAGIRAGFPVLAGGWLGFERVIEWTRDGARIDRAVLDFDVARKRHPEIMTRLTAVPAMPFGLSAGTPHLMGIVNVTPDSFSDGGRFASHEAAIARGRAAIGEGAAILDIGGESTRPGATPVSPEDEQARILPVIETLSAEGHAVSVDTRHAATMQAALKAGAGMINDVSALTHDPDALGVAAESDCPIVLMHAQGNPQTMQQAPTYTHALLDIYDALEDRIAACAQAGIDRSRLTLDPGIGFGKTLEHNLQLLGGLGMFHGLGCPVLLGFSRKSVIGKLDAHAEVDQRIGGSLAGIAAGLNAGVQIMRVHDVFESAQFLKVSGAIAQAL